MCRELIEQHSATLNKNKKKLITGTYTNTDGIFSSRFVEQNLLNFSLIGHQEVIERHLSTGNGQRLGVLSSTISRMIKLVGTPTLTDPDLNLH